MNIKKRGIAGRWKRATGRRDLLNMSSCSTVQGQTRVISYTNFVELESWHPILHAKFQDYRTIGPDKVTVGDGKVSLAQVLRPIATYLKVVRRKSEPVPNLVPVWRESTRGDILCLGRGVRGISPEKNFDLWLPLCAFSMHLLCVLGQNFSRLGLIWNRQYLHIHNGTLA